MSHFALCYFVAQAFAHPIDMALVQAKFSGATVSASIDLNPSIVGIVLGLRSEELTPGKVSENTDRLVQTTLGEGVLEVGTGKCRWSKPGIEYPNPNTVRISGEASCASSGDTISWRFPFIKRPGIPSTFHVLVKAEIAGEQRMQTGEPGNDRISFSIPPKRTWWQTGADFISRRFR